MNSRFGLSGWRMAGMLSAGAAYTIGFIWLGFLTEQVEQQTVYLGHLIGTVIFFAFYLADLLYHYVEKVRVEELLFFSIVSFVWEVELLLIIMGSFVPPQSSPFDKSG